jgi:hypothetical protein
MFFLVTRTLAREEESTTMTTTTERLSERLQQAEAELAALDPQIATALADETDTSKLRARRRELMEQCDDLAEAISFAEGRHADARRKADADKSQALRADAREKGAAFTKAAADVDSALAQLEQAFARFKLTTVDLSRSLRLAGMADDARIANAITPSLRWAAWLAAPAFSEQSQIPRAEAHRRKSLRDSVSRLIPRIDT